MNENSFYNNHDTDVYEKPNNLTDEEKLAMFNIIKNTCDAYDIPLNNLEDAENFWMLIRYGYTKQEREEQAALMKFCEAKHREIFDEMNAWYDELKEKYPHLANNYNYIKTK